MDALEKMKQHFVALHLFVKMRERDATIVLFTLNIPIDCFCFVNSVDFVFSVLGSLVKRGYKLNVATKIALVKGLFLEGKVEAEEFFVKLVILKMCELNEMKFTYLRSICQKMAHENLFKEK